MPTLKFLDQKKEVQFDGELLEAFIASFPVRERCSALAAALGRYGMSLPTPPEGVEKLLFARRDAEWERGGHSARCQLLRDENFLGVLSESQAQVILSSVDEGFLQALYRGLRHCTWEVLPASPRLLPQTRIRLMEAILVANEAEWAKNFATVHDAVARRMAIEDASRLVAEKFPREAVREGFERCFYPEKYRNTPSLGLCHAPLEMAITLEMRGSVRHKQDILTTWALQQRHGRQQHVALEIGAEAYPLNLELLLTICDYCDLEEGGEALVTPLFDTGHPLIRASIIYSGHLSREQQDEAWVAGHADVCRELLRQPEFYDNLSDAQAEDIMALDDQLMLQEVARMIHLLYLPPGHPENRRLSPKMRDRLLAFVAGHDDPEVTRFFEPHDIPARVLESLKPHRKQTVQQ